MYSEATWIEWEILGPIDLAEDLAENNDWEFDRVDDDQINFVVAGQWRHYAVTLVMSHADETLRLLCSFDLNPPKIRHAALRELIGLANDRCWTGSFSHCPGLSAVVFRYGLLLCEGAMATMEQVDAIVTRSVATCEQYYPAFQLTCRAGKSPDEALELAITDVSGCA